MYRAVSACLWHPYTVQYFEGCQVAVELLCATEGAAHTVQIVLVQIKSMQTGQFRPARRQQACMAHDTKRALVFGISALSAVIWL